MATKHDPRPDPEVWKELRAIRCKACIESGRGGGLLGFLARQRGPLPEGRNYVGFGGFDPAIHGDSVWVEDGWKLYRPQRDEWCLHVAAKHHLGQRERASSGVRHQTVTTLSLPYSGGRCDRCSRVVQLDRDRLVRQMAGGGPRDLLA